MATLRHDLLTVASAAFAIRCDDAAYDAETRESAWDLWCLALELLSSHERRVAAELGILATTDAGADSGRHFANLLSSTPFRLVPALPGGES